MDRGACVVAVVAVAIGVEIASCCGSTSGRRLGVPRHVLAYRIEKYGIGRTG